MLSKDRILYEDNHLIVINKLPGDLVQGDRTGDRTLQDDVKEYLKVTYNKPGNVYLGSPHRLDRPTSCYSEYQFIERCSVFHFCAIFRLFFAVLCNF